MLLVPVGFEIGFAAGEANEAEVPSAPAGVIPLVPLGAEGVADGEPAMGGSDSMSEAPNDDVGLNGFKPAKPVAWGWSGFDTDIDGTDEV